MSIDTMVEPRRESDDERTAGSPSMPPSPASFGASRTTPVSAPDREDEVAGRRDHGT